jgi:hypothetical protein
MCVYVGATQLHENKGENQMTAFTEIDTNELKQAIDTLNTMLWHVLDNEHHSPIADAIETILRASKSQMRKQGEPSYSLAEAIDVATLALQGEVKKREAETEAAKNENPHMVVRHIETLKADEIKVGTQVLINLNPHHSGAENILGIITTARLGEGFAGCDLVDVTYEHPGTGETHTMPFSLEKLSMGNSAALTACAERHEAIAAEFRRLAAQSLR